MIARVVLFYLFLQILRKVLIFALSITIILRIRTLEEVTEVIGGGWMTKCTLALFVASKTGGGNNKILAEDARRDHNFVSTCTITRGVDGSLAIVSESANWSCGGCETN